MDDNALMPEELSSLSSKLGLHLRYFHNRLMYNFVPYKDDCPWVPPDEICDTHAYGSQPIEIGNWSAYCHGGLKQKKPEDYVYEFDTRAICFVCVNTYSPDLGHNMAELFVLYQIYENYFKNLAIPGKQIKVLTAKSYLGFKPGHLPSYLKHTSLCADDWVIAPEEGRAFYRGNFVYVDRVKNYEPNLSVSTPLSRSFFTLNDELVSEANRKYAGAPFHKRLMIVRGEDLETYWHKRHCTNISNETINAALAKHGFHKMVFPPRKENADEDDFLYQAYLVSKADVIFTEAGKAFINIFFMRKGAKYLTLFPPCIPTYAQTPQVVADLNEVVIKTYMDTELDKTNKFFLNAGPGDKLALPYRIKDVEAFVGWFDDAMGDTKPDAFHSFPL